MTTTSNDMTHYGMKIAVGEKEQWQLLANDRFNGRLSDMVKAAVFEAWCVEYGYLDEEMFYLAELDNIIDRIVACLHCTRENAVKYATRHLNTTPVTHDL